MLTSWRRLAAFALLFAVLLPLIGTIAGAGVCNDECSAACGDCAVCGVAACMTATAELRAEPPARASLAPSSDRPGRIGARAIEHVPLPAA